MFEYLIYNRKSVSATKVTIERPFIEEAKYVKVERIINDYHIEYLRRVPDKEVFYEDDDFAVLILGKVYRNTGQRTIERQSLTPKDCVLLFETEYSDLRGFFHIIKIDKKSGELVLINDLFGLRPIYYGHDIKYYFICNSLSVLKKTFDLQINYTALVEKTIFEHNLNDKTIYSYVWCLAEASFLILKDRFFKKSYFSWYDYFLSAQDSFRFDREAYRECFNTLVNDTASNDENNLIPLTGGHDGRALLSSVLKNKLPFETFSFGRAGSENTCIPEQIAKKLDFKHTSIYLEAKFEEDYKNNGFQTLYLSDGELIYSQQSILYAMKEIGARSFPLLSGLLAGELLGPVHLIKDYISPSYYKHFYKIAPFDVYEAWRPYKDYFNIELTSYVKEELHTEIEKRLNQLNKLRYSPNYHLLSLCDMITWGFRKFYGYQMHLSRFHVDNYPVFCDFDLLNMMIMSDYNNIYRNSYRSLYRRRDSRRLQLFLINKNSKELANVILDRGYTPRQAVNPLYLGYKLAKYYNRKQRIKAGRHIPEFLGQEWTRLIVSETDNLVEMIRNSNDLIKVNSYVNDLLHNAKSRNEVGIISNILFLCQ